MAMVGCAVCTEPLPARPPGSRGRPLKYCSATCRTRAATAVQAAKNAANMAALRAAAKADPALAVGPAGPRDDGRCRHCLSTIAPLLVRGKCRTFCSTACARADSHRRDAATVTVVRRAARFDDLKCQQCDAPLTHRRATKYCSTLCGEIARGVRQAVQLERRTCALPECDVAFQPRRDSTRCCSESHGKRLWRIEADARGYRQPARPWDDRRRNEYHRRRALKENASTGEPVRLGDILERDRWKCGLCKKRIPKRATYPDPLSPSLDHIVPLTKGGDHDPANAIAAHLRCNVSKGNRGGGEQLALIG